MCFMFIFGNFIDACYVVFIANKGVPRRNSCVFPVLKVFLFLFDYSSWSFTKMSTLLRRSSQARPQTIILEERYSFCVTQFHCHGPLFCSHFPTNICLSSYNSHDHGGDCPLRSFPPEDNPEPSISTSHSMTLFVHPS